MAQFKIPKELGVKEMLGMLYSGLTVQSADVISTDKGSNTLIAVYIDDEDQPVTVCACDFSFVAYSGAALTMIPKGGADDAASSGDFSDMLLGNFNEVMNICSRLFMDSSTPHLRLDKSYKIDEIPENISNILATATGKAGFDVEIENYGKGNLSFIAT